MRRNSHFYATHVKPRRLTGQASSTGALLHCNFWYFFQVSAVQPTLKTAILPCEIKSREFNSKLLLACIMAERGWRVFVGSRNHIHLALGHLPRSVYVGKDIRFSSRQIVRILKRLGHQFVARTRRPSSIFPANVTAKREFIPKSSALPNAFWPGGRTMPSRGGNHLLTMELPSISPATDALISCAPNCEAFTRPRRKNSTPSMVVLSWSTQILARLIIFTPI